MLVWPKSAGKRKRDPDIGASILDPVGAQQLLDDIPRWQQLS
jgi:hypothetical protein